ncbi:MAG TPA: hypothetical protein VGQ62_18850 [Chloroflexota bacterium]|jgi:hypothetical protein|nr:hypothetical protein [Chloroflexota bacterium]
MRGTIVLSVLASSVVSVAVTALLMLALLPSAVDAQVAKLTASGLSVVGADGRPGVSVDVGPPGGGILQVFGSDGKTVRLSLNSSGQPGAAGIAPNAGLNLYNVDGLEVVRVGSIQALNGYAFNLRDAQGNTRYRAAVDGNGDATIQLFDAEGNVIWSAP